MIANEIMEALCLIRIPGEARQILDVILRKTYGWKKKEDMISLSQFKESTDLSYPSIIRARGKLLKMNIISVYQKVNCETLTYRFQKNYSEWRPFTKKKTIYKKVNQRLPKSKHTKETLTKEIKKKKKKSEPKIFFDFKKEKFLNIKEKDIEGWKKAYPACEIEMELEQMKQWLLSNPDKKKKLYRRFITNWLSRSQDRGGSIRVSGHIRPMTRKEEREKGMDDWAEGKGKWAKKGTEK